MGPAALTVPPARLRAPPLLFNPLPALKVALLATLMAPALVTLPVVASKPVALRTAWGPWVRTPPRMAPLRLSVALLEKLPL